MRRQVAMLSNDIVCRFYNNRSGAHKTSLLRLLTTFFAGTWHCQEGQERKKRDESKNRKKESIDEGIVASLCFEISDYRFWIHFMLIYFLDA